MEEILPLNTSSIPLSSLHLSDEEISKATSNSPRKSSFSYIYKGGRNAKGERHGFGSAVFNNGDEYRGEYRNNIRSGYGEYTYNRQRHSGAKYTGMYMDNQKNGYGIFIYPDTSR